MYCPLWSLSNLVIALSGHSCRVTLFLSLANNIYFGEICKINPFHLEKDLTNTL